jgi:hypothetical protein
MCPLKNLTLLSYLPCLDFTTPTPGHPKDGLLTSEAKEQVYENPCVLPKGDTGTNPQLASPGVYL